MGVTKELSQRFDELDALLCRHRSLWQLVPFAHHDWPWLSSHPSLCAYLQQLTAADVDALESQPEALASALAPHVPDVASLQPLCHLPQLTQQIPALPARLVNHIKGRKLEQIHAFSNAVTPGHEPVLEWCAGKGHLGRLLAWEQRRPVTSVEIQTQLCIQGERKAAEFDLPVQFHQADVLKGEADDLLHSHPHAVALHACGELHLRLLRKASQAGTDTITLSPCCYHKIPQTHYVPLSRQAGASRLRLSQHDLRLPLQQTVVAGKRISRLRTLEVAWRLGFDALQQDVTGNNRYLPVPPLQKKLLSGQFADFCHWAAAKKQIRLPLQVDFEHYLQAGWRHRALTMRLELVRHLFRRPLEVWLALDRALYLQERGYQVELSQFCSWQITPRNLLIRARRQGVAGSQGKM